MGLLTCPPLCAILRSDCCLRWCCHIHKKDAIASRKFVEAGCQANVHSGNIGMEMGPFEDVFPIEHGDIPLLCYFTRG